MISMNMQELKQLIYKGEKVDIECKEAESNVPRSAYESYSAFANTKGGFIILGVKEDKKKTLSQERFIIQGIRQIVSGETWRIQKGQKRGQGGADTCRSDDVWRRACHTGRV